MPGLLVIIAKLVFIVTSTSAIFHGDRRWQNAATFGHIEDFMYRLRQGNEVFVHWVIMVSTLILFVSLIQRLPDPSDRSFLSLVPFRAAIFSS